MRTIRRAKARIQRNIDIHDATLFDLAWPLSCRGRKREGRRASRTDRERRHVRWTAARWERRLLIAAVAAWGSDD